MPITGLVIGLDPTPTPQGVGPSALESIAADERCVIGTAPTPGRIPVVIETGTRTESRRLLDWIAALPGVLTVEIAYADFAEASGPRTMGPPAQEHGIDGD